MTQPTGFPLPDWSARLRPPRTAMEGRFCRVEPIDPSRHAADLHAANLLDATGANWTYLGYGPFGKLEEYREWMTRNCLGDDPLFHAVITRDGGRAVGVASYLRIEESVGVMEVGHINFAPPLQRTPASTEAMYLMMRRAFDELGYRRYEWKCDVLNAPSRAAAERLGFTFEGVFRQATIYKKRNRDTAW
jgi:RimJ/RimL family protein N-acetyltransferase